MKNYDFFILSSSCTYTSRANVANKTNETEKKYYNIFIAMYNNSKGIEGEYYTILVGRRNSNKK